MTRNFEVGRTYNRRADIHSHLGGQQQGGIITPSAHNVVIIITGEEGLAHGYADRYRPDGAFEYFGEGQVGDMQLIRGNAAIAEHSQDGKQLLLFRKTKDGLRFEGEMVYERHHIERAPDRNGNTRDAIVFELRPLSAIVERVEDEIEPSGSSIDLLRKRAMAAAGVFPPSQVTSARNVYQRSRDVRLYVLARAAGKCEGCDGAAPFLRADSTPYLEPHHIRRVSDGGPDHPAHVIALCPNCHRRVHASIDAERFNSSLARRMLTLEPVRAG